MVDWFSGSLGLVGVKSGLGQSRATYSNAAFPENQGSAINGSLWRFRFAALKMQY